MTSKKSVAQWGDERIEPGQTRDLKITISESYSGMSVRIPIRVQRAAEPGPTVFVTAALHGDELNGTGAIRALLHSNELQIARGSLILIPVLNLLAFDRHSRYLPDRRDLNRCFPGSEQGSLASRMARRIFDEIVMRSDFGIDLHTAAVRRTNYPNIRADMSDQNADRLARAFGCEIILDGKGPKGSLRREATKAGCPTIIFEGGEVWKVEPGVVNFTIQGIINVLRSLGMSDGEPTLPEQQMVIERVKWLRAERGGFLQFHVAPGQTVSEGQAIATNTSLLGQEKNTVVAPFDGIVIGMTTLPAIAPGEPICNLGKLPKTHRLSKVEKTRAEGDGATADMIDQLSTNVMVIEKDERPEE